MTNLIYNDIIYNQWNYLELVKNYIKKADMLWSCSEVFRTPIKFDSHGNYIQGTGTNLASVFKMPYDELMKYIYIMVTEMHFTYADFNEMPFFEITKLINLHKDRVEEQNKEHEGEQTRIENTMASMKHQYNPENYKAPKFEQPKMPSINMPKFN